MTLLHRLGHAWKWSAFFMSGALLYSVWWNWTKGHPQNIRLHIYWENIIVCISKQRGLETSRENCFYRVMNWILEKRRQLIFQSGFSIKITNYILLHYLAFIVYFEITFIFFIINICILIKKHFPLSKRMLIL